MLFAEASAVNATALLPEFETAMAKKQITFLPAQETDVERGQTLMQNAVSQRNAGKSGTQSKSAARTHAEELLSGVQVAAAQKYLLTDPGKIHLFILVNLFI